MTETRPLNLREGAALVGCDPAVLLDLAFTHQEMFDLELLDWELALIWTSAGPMFDPHRLRSLDLREYEAAMCGEGSNS